MTRIMVVDDHLDILDITETILKSRNYEVESFSSPVKFLERVEEFRPDLILLDIMMPEMDGWKVLEVLEEKGVTEWSKLVLFTVKNTFETDITDARAKQCYYYFQKPMSTRVLLEKIEAILKD